MPQLLRSLRMGKKCPTGEADDVQLHVQVESGQVHRPFPECLYLFPTVPHRPPITLSLPITCFL